jgi:hypothetical protein
MKTIRTEILINASAEKIWQVLIDFEKYPEWNPFIKKISGEKRPGGQMRVVIQPQGQKGMEFTPVIQKYETNAELQWLGHLWITGLFDGRHSFKLVPIDQSRTLFIHSEQFTGLLVGMLWKSLQSPTLGGFEQMNQALKSRAERAR